MKLLLQIPRSGVQGSGISKRQLFLWRRGFLLLVDSCLLFLFGLPLSTVQS